MQALTVPSSIATFPAAPATAAKSETKLLRGIVYGVAIQSATIGAIAGAWLMVRHF